MPFRKGQSGNPGGRAKARPAKTALMMELSSAGDNVKELREIMRQVIEQAKAGEAWAVQFIADRLDGKPSQQVDLNVEDGRDFEDQDELVARALELQAISVEVKPLPTPTHDVGEDKQ